MVRPRKVVCRRDQLYSKPRRVTGRERAGLGGRGHTVRWGSSDGCPTKAGGKVR